MFRPSRGHLQPDTYMFRPSMGHFQVDSYIFRPSRRHYQHEDDHYRVETCSCLTLFSNLELS